MNVRCERCNIEYDFDDALVSIRGTTVTCTQCDYTFRILRRRDGDYSEDFWNVRTEDQRMLVFTSLRELQRAIRGGLVSQADVLSRGGLPGKPITDIPELTPFFCQLGASFSDDEAPVHRTVLSESPPPMRSRTSTQPDFLRVDPREERDFSDLATEESEGPRSQREPEEPQFLDEETPLVSAILSVIPDGPNSPSTRSSRPGFFVDEAGFDPSHFEPTHSDSVDSRIDAADAETAAVSFLDAVVRPPSAKEATPTPAPGLAVGARPTFALSGPAVLGTVLFVAIAAMVAVRLTSRMNASPVLARASSIQEEALAAPSEERGPRLEPALLSPGFEEAGEGELAKDSPDADLQTQAASETPVAPSAPRGRPDQGETPRGQRSASIRVLAPSKEPGDVRALVSRAERERNGGNLDEAQALYASALERNPRDTEALFGLAAVASARHDSILARAQYRRVLAVNSSYAPAWVALGDAEWEAGDSSAAVEAYRQIVDRLPAGSYPPRVRQRLEALRGATIPEREAPSAPLPRTNQGREATE